MAVTIYGTVGVFPDWSAPWTAGALGLSASVEHYFPWPQGGSVVATYLNKCVDGITGQWHLWQTFFQDRTGVYYKANGGQQFDPGTYKVETIVHGREQN